MIRDIYTTICSRMSLKMSDDLRSNVGLIQRQKTEKIMEDWRKNQVWHLSSGRTQRSEEETCVWCVTVITCFIITYTKTACAKPLTTCQRDYCIDVDVRFLQVFASCGVNLSLFLPSVESCTGVQSECADFSRDPDKVRHNSQLHCSVFWFWYCCFYFNFSSVIVYIFHFVLLCFCFCAAIWRNKEWLRLM